MINIVRTSLKSTLKIIILAHYARVLTLILSLFCCCQLALEYGIKFMETSAKANINVENVSLTFSAIIHS